MDSAGLPGSSLREPIDSASPACLQPCLAMQPLQVSLNKTHMGTREHQYVRPVVQEILVDHRDHHQHLARTCIMVCEQAAVVRQYMRKTVVPSEP